MYTTINYTSPRKNYRHKTNYINYNNKLKILDDTTIDGKIKLEISYSKNKGIYHKQLNINKENLSGIIDKFKNRNFIIEDPSKIDLCPISNIENKVGNYRHHEYGQNLSDNFKRQAYNNSFKQKYM